MIFVNAFNSFIDLLSLALLLFQAFALVDAAIRPADAYAAAGKWTKQAWVIVLGLAVAAGLIAPNLFLFRIIGLIAAIVYVVDVRPAVKALGGPRGSRGY